MEKILVTPRSLSKNGHPALARLRDAGYDVVFATPGEQPGPEELTDRLPGCVAYLAGLETIPPKVLRESPGLKVISRNGVGVTNVPFDTCRELGIEVRKTVGANARGVAELTWAHILAVYRDLVFHDGTLKRHDWQRRNGVELGGKTLGIVGCGHIGRLVVGYGLAFGMRVLAYDPWPPRAFSPGEGFALCDLDRVAAEADVLSLHRPPSEDGTPLVDDGFLAKMKDGAVLVNTARAGLCDDRAVRAALDRGKLRAFTVDVFEPEPPDDWTLVDSKRVLATPHIGGYSGESVDRVTEGAVDNILDVLGGGRTPGSEE